MPLPTITSIEWATLVGSRPREAGCNARLGVHGTEVGVPLARIHTSDGASGFGPCRATPAQAEQLLGMAVADLISADPGVTEHRLFEFPLWDLLGQRERKPVYQLLAECRGRKSETPLLVPCYDTSLYIDDLHLDSDEAAATLIAEEAGFGFERNHRAFKIKVGRGARHMPIDAGTRRDIAVIRAVREAVGPDAVIMIDANNGYNLNLTKRVLAETSACNLFWLEEAFHEDPVLYGDLRSWMENEGLNVLIADGEGQASPLLMEYARDGIVDVVQYDIFGHGLTSWLRTGEQLDQWQVRSAPHHYGRHIGNYVSAHLAAALEHFTFVEWDEVATPGIDADAYRVRDGMIAVPDSPGFGLALDESTFQQAIAANGFRVRI